MKRTLMLVVVAVALVAGLLATSIGWVVTSHRVDDLERALDAAQEASTAAEADAEQAREKIEDLNRRIATMRLDWDPEVVHVLAR